MTVNVGDRFWVKECFLPDPPSDDDAWDDHSYTYVQWSGCGCKAADVPNALRKPAHCIYRADPTWDDVQMIWKTGRYMPRWASRMTLVVEEVRIERLQNISEEDAAAEGWPAPENRAQAGVAEIRDAYPIGWYAALWDTINGPGAWDRDPWVVVYRYRVERRNIDADAR
ncbi:hypothetical protein IFT84_20380 [Rhizobium sp. CFBP 8762]|uniref:hypothetical protein n=1 Tax=Rhizobium sp. CFBP 8762 TaxID=2775279 RepID=UPI00177F05F4|nr:hypothetical protein [Rhizobium sp. CFBP 8762]MBD8556872.1 hypothetical protein [Rhizobium sp. CFBP 8762]